MHRHFQQSTNESYPECTETNAEYLGAYLDHPAQPQPANVVEWILATTTIEDNTPYDHN